MLAIVLVLAAVFAMRKKAGKCSVCKGNILPSELFIVDPCAHAFHSDCVQLDWMSENRCPACNPTPGDKRLCAALSRARKKKNKEIQREYKRRRFCKLSLVWTVVEAGILSAGFYIAEWEESWFLSMQLVNLFSLLSAFFSGIIPCLNASSGNLASGFSFATSIITGVLTYHSALGFALSAESLLLAVFWFWFTVALVYVIYTAVLSPSRVFLVVRDRTTPSAYFLWLSSWASVELGILAAKFRISAWSAWFPWLQGLQITAIVLIIASKIFHYSLQRFRRRAEFTTFVFAKFFIIFASLFSYHSIICFLFSDWELFHVSFWPWIAVAILSTYFNELRRREISSDKCKNFATNV